MKKVDKNFFYHALTYPYTDEKGEKKLQIVPGLTTLDEVALRIFSSNRMGKAVKREEIAQEAANAFAQAEVFLDVRYEYFQKLITDEE